MSQNGHEERSCTERARAPDAARGARAARPVRAGQRRPCSRPQQPPLPLLLHLAAPASGALPHLPLRTVRPAHQRHGHRQHMRTRRKTALLSRRVGEKHPLLPRPTGHRPSGVTQTSLVRTLRPKCITVLHATPRGAAPRRRRPTRVADGGGPSSRLHGSHTDLPRTSGEAESAPRGLGGVLLSEGDRPLHDRCVRFIGRATHRKFTREVTVRARGVLPESVPQPADAVREAFAKATIVTDRQFPSDRAAVLRAARGEDADRDLDKGHAVVRELVLVAVHGDHVTYDVETAGGGLIDALRLSAVPAEPAFRPVPALPA